MANGDISGVTIGGIGTVFGREPYGIQLGIINIAKNNPSPFRVLPIVNVHFE
jgi:hypothetical protein